jgi:hypothetical protein
MAEAMSSEPDAAFMQESNDGESALPHCECGCVETEIEQGRRLVLSLRPRVCRL